MTIAEQMQCVRDAFAEWAREHNGTAVVASDQVHMLDLLRTKPAGVLAAVLWNAEESRDADYSRLGRVDRAYKVVLSRGRGFRLDTGESLTDGVAGGPPMFDLVEEARELVRGLRFSEETTEIIPDYQGSGPFEVQGLLLDAYEIRFSIGTQIPLQDEVPN